MNSLAWLATAIGALYVIDRLAGLCAAKLLRPKPPPGFVVVAHRGASRDAPENTIAAFTRAAEIGARGVECDVVLTADGVPVIAHHHDLKDLVGPNQGPSNISNLNLEELKRIDVGSWFDQKFSDERVPTLAEALECFRSRFDRIYLHDKHHRDVGAPDIERVRAIANVIVASGLLDRIHVMVSSGDITPWREVAPEISVIQGRNGPDGRARRIPLGESYRAGLRNFVVYCSPRSLLTRGRILAEIRLTNLGYLTGFWPPKKIVTHYSRSGGRFVVFTVNDELKAKLYLRAGFDAIGTDDPRFLVDLVKRLQA